MGTSLQEKEDINATQKVTIVHKKNLKVRIWGALAFAVGVTALYLLSGNNNETVMNEFQYENNVTVGLMPGVDRDAMLAALQSNVDESAIAFSVNGNPVLEDSQINILFENPTGNNKDLVVEIFENKTETSLYKSNAIKEGSYLKKVKISEKLEKGSNPATVYITAYDVETHEIIGQAAAEIVIMVL